MTKNNFPIVSSSVRSLGELASSSFPTLGSSLTSAVGGQPDSPLAYAIASVATEPCPPGNARNDEVVVYRLVSGSPPTKEDFLPTCMDEGFPHREFPPEKLCIAQGVSVFTNEKAIDKKRKRYQKLNEKLIAIGTIFKEDGRVLETCSKFHLTWWLETDVPHCNFRLVTNNASA